MKRVLSILLCLILSFGMLTGCGGDTAAEMNAGYAEDMEYQYAETMGPAEGSLSSDTELENLSTADRKLIKTVRISAETETYDVLMDGLTARINELGGYIESRESDSYRRRSCTMVIRIPAAGLSGFVDHVNANANVTSSSETAQDVTLEYVDTEAKITALETEQARLLELLAAAEDLEAILMIEERLSDVTYELERYASRLRTLSNQVEYATVYLTVYEVEVLTPTEDPTVWDRISTGFGETLTDLGENITDLFVWVIVESPNIVIFAVLVFLLFRILRKVDKHAKAKNAQPENKSE